MMSTTTARRGLTRAWTAAAFILACALAGSAQEIVPPEKPRLSLPVLRPDAPREETTYGFLSAAPAHRFLEHGRVELTFETREPTPPVTVYLGLNPLKDDLDYPLYRTSVRESGEASELRARHSVVLDLKALTRYLPTTPFENRATYRIEAYLPAKRSSRFFEGRIYFEPQTLGDTESLVEGPFVDMVTDSTAVISWIADRDSAGAVLVGDRTFTSSASDRRHEARVTGLKLGALTEYRVRCGRTTTRPYSFRTDGGDRFTFASMVDSREGVGGGQINLSGVNAYALKILGADLYRKGADFIVFAGDLINGYVTDVRDFELMLQAFKAAMQPLHSRIPIYESMGNHEALLDSFRVDGARISVDKAGEDSAEAAFARAFVNPTDGPEPEIPGAPTYRENVYTFRRGNALFVMLNNNYWWSSNPHIYGGNLEGYILPKQMDWLRNVVERAGRDPSVRHIFYAAQEPPFPNGGHTGDSMWYRGGDTNRDGKVDAADIDIVGNRNTMWSIIASTPKSVAFITGDEHAYARTRIDDGTPVGHKRGLDGRDVRFRHTVWQVTSGGAGAPFYDQETDLPWTGAVAAHSIQPHYALFSVDGLRVNLEAYSITGQLIDKARLK